MSKLAGKIAVITGGNSGIGLTTAAYFVAEGAYVYITGRRQRELDAAVALIGKNVTAVQGDVTNLANLDRLYAQISAEKGRIDILFANAGITNQHATLDKLTEQNYDLAFDTNVRGVLFTVQKALPLMGPGSSIILNSSVAAVKGVSGMTVNAASKAAVRSFARTWTTELSDRGIRVNVVSGGYIDTPILKTHNLTDEQIEQVNKRLATTMPMHRLGTSEEIAKAVVFLASDDSSYMSGSDIAIDGGLAQV
ncbi:SDR family oxidoreductase [Granulicella sp. dw_53]|uniref:SDR family oxidoreductase n=1 Tax=Granulicella sp. dw_53 TaxID=2719792 RepID=UPI001BD6836C|nr:SDR family oxidoreductase [Granulicella sp. dw_53]